MNAKPFPTNAGSEETNIEAWIARTDPDDWEEVEAAISPELTITLQLSLDHEQRRMLTEAAWAANMPVIRWIKQLAFDRAQRHSTETVTTSHSSMVFAESHFFTHGRLHTGHAFNAQCDRP